MKEYYSERFSWIFNYTSKNFFYCLAKTLCLIVGLPIYCVMVAVEMVLTFVNMLFSWIPILGMVIGVICKSIIFVIEKTFYICIITDLGKWIRAHPKKLASNEADADSQNVDILLDEKADDVSEENKD